MYETSTFVQSWKDTVRPLVKARYPKLTFDKKKLETFLDKLLEKKMNNRKVTLINNYTNQTARTDILSLTDLIENNHLIISGGGCLFIQHGLKVNLLVDFIISKMTLRNTQKGVRRNYEEGTALYATWNRAQDGTKLIEFKVA